MRARFALFLLAAVLGCVAFMPIARAKRAQREGVPTLAAELRRSRSLGFPWEGSLTRGVELKPDSETRYVTEYAKTGHFYGTWDLVQLLHRAAHRVAVRYPGAKLSVGELSRQGGGNLPGHASHESGRDADLGFYMLDGQGRPYEAFAFATFDDEGQGTGPNRGLRLDVPRNWELVSRLVADGDARVQFLFVAPAIKRLLLAEGKRSGAPRRVLDRAAQVMVKPSEKHTHGNHFHLRVYCSPGDRPKCRDSGPFWPWYAGDPPLATKSPFGPPS